VSTVKPLTKDMLALPSVSAAIEAAVAADRAIWVEKVLTRRAYAVLRRKGLSEHEARSRLSYSKSLANLTAQEEEQIK
jgi:hypothetical protein